MDILSHIFRWVNPYIYIYIYVSMDIYMYIWIYIYMCVCVCVEWLKSNFFFPNSYNRQPNVRENVVPDIFLYSRLFCLCVMVESPVIRERILLKLSSRSSLPLPSSSTWCRLSCLVWDLEGRWMALKHHHHKWPTQTQWCGRIFGFY